MKARTKLLWRSVTLTLAYAGIGLSTSYLAQGLSLSFPFWPAAGLAIAIVLAHGYRYLPAIALGSVLVDGVLSDWHLPLALTLAAGSTLQIALAAWCGRRISGVTPALRHPKEILPFLIVMGPVCSLLGSSVGAYAQYFFGEITASQIPFSAFTWWAGDVLGIIVFTPATLMFLPTMQYQWQGRRTKVLFPSLLLMIMAAIAYDQIYAFETQRIRLELQECAQNMAHQFEKNLTRHTEALQGVESFILSSETVTASEFRTFTRHSLENLPGLSALSWNPFVLDTERQAFEAQQRLDPLIPDDFQITERLPNGELIPAQKRPSYVVVQFIEPFNEKHRIVQGFDIQSDPQRAAAVINSMETDQAYATEPLTLLQDTNGQRSILVLLPVNSQGESVRGFAVGVYRLDNLLAEVFSVGTCAQQQNLRVALLYTTESGQTLNLDQLDPPNPTAHRKADLGEIATTETEPITVPIRYWGRTWQLQIQPTEALIWAKKSYTPQLVLTIALILLLFNESFLLLVTAEELAERRQAVINSYQASHDPLTDLLNRRAFFATLEQARSEANSGLANHVLLFCDLDHFKPVNDTVGHNAGDVLLRDIAHLLAQQVRAEDQVARVGGDEFALLLRNCTLENGLAIAEAIVSVLKNYTFTWQQEIFQITISIGLILLTSESAPLPSVDDLMAQADQACYRAKRSGRNQVCVG
ncbi:diguanylate cyclase domain-containing protein [Synechococcus sp. BDU 130192]|uniref:diguanylate cyclase domain-containing protein n=1 Tax=Synechococcus sp. BDU 130192 TaxID=2042059 RepID=UPI000C06852F|nr:diguanylate cyclase [Synechococcus sp. BDU 130192]